MTALHELLPHLRVLVDGSHVAVCPACEAESPVEVAHRPDESTRFATSAHLDEGGRVIVDEYIHGEIVSYDASAHDRHVQEVHGAPVHS